MNKAATKVLRATGPSAGRWCDEVEAMVVGSTDNTTKKKSTETNKEIHKAATDAKRAPVPASASTEGASAVPDTNPHLYRQRSDKEEQLGLNPFNMRRTGALAPIDDAMTMTYSCRRK